MTGFGEIDLDGWINVDTPGFRLVLKLSFFMATKFRVETYSFYDDLHMKIWCCNNHIQLRFLCPQQIFIILEL